MGKKSTRRLIVNFTPKFVVSIINMVLHRFEYFLRLGEKSSRHSKNTFVDYFFRNKRKDNQNACSPIIPRFWYIKH